MGRYKNILVAFDGSDSSKNALKQALDIAKREYFRVTAVTVLKTYDTDLESARNRNALEARGSEENVLTNSVKIVIDEGDEVQTILEEGVVHEAIINAAESRDCDLIITGRRGLSKLERAFMGSVTAQIIRYSPIDVLVMPRIAQLGWKRLLLATDGSACSESATDRALDLALDHGGSLSVVSVIETTDTFYTEMPGNLERMRTHVQENIDKVKMKADVLNIKVEGYVREGETNREIVMLAKDIKADVICMGSHGRTGLERILMGSVTEQVLHNAPCSVLVVKSKLCREPVAF